MAWKDIETGAGPYPMHAGEYCGNYNKDWPAVSRLNQSKEGAKREQEQYLSRMRFGKPRPCQAYPTVELAEAAGLVGLYANSDSHAFSWYVQCETPLELMEPGQEHLYNLNGKPGISTGN